MQITNKQNSQLKEQLLTQEVAVQKEIQSEMSRRANEPYNQLTGDGADAGEIANADLIVDVDNERITLLLAELREISAALERIELGSYGICIQCGEPIPFLRLQAYPTANRCTACQLVHERTFNSVKHSRM